MNDVITRSARGARGSKGWAVVTGASSGLGAEFARQLAARGYDLILTARRRDRMDALGAELEAKYSVQALVIEGDLAVPGAVGQLVRDLEGRGIVPQVLINNAGFGSHGVAIDVPLERTVGIIQVNVTALTELTIALGAKMAVRGSGAILNVASTSAFQPTPFFAVYGATKAYVTSFSQAIARELSPRGVRVVALCPGPTRTEFFDTNDVTAHVPEATVMSAERCVRIGIRALDRGGAVVVAGVANAIGAWFARVSPQWLVVRVSQWLMRPRRALPAKT